MAKNLTLDDFTGLNAPIAGLAVRQMRKILLPEFERWYEQQSRKKPAWFPPREPLDPDTYLDLDHWDSAFVTFLLEKADGR